MRVLRSHFLISRSIEANCTRSGWWTVYPRGTVVEKVQTEQYISTLAEFYRKSVQLLSISVTSSELVVLLSRAGLAIVRSRPVHYMYRSATYYFQRKMSFSVWKCQDGRREHFSEESSLQCALRLSGGQTSFRFFVVHGREMQQCRRNLGKSIWRSCKALDRSK